VDVNELDHCCPFPFLASFGSSSPGDTPVAIKTANL
jgi:hypothetical protein